RLHRRDGLNGMSPAYRLCAGFRKAKMFHFACLNQIAYGTGNFFDWHLRIDAMLVEQIDCVNLETFKRRFSNLFDMVRLAIDSNGMGTAVRIEFIPKLGRNDDLVAHWKEGLAHQLFVLEGTINFRCIEEGHAQVDCFSEQRDYLRSVFYGAIRPAHTHAAKSKS